MYRHLRLRLLEGDSGGNSAGGTSQAGASSSTSGQEPTTTPPTPQAGDGTTLTPEEAQRIIADLRRENADHRTKRKASDDKLKVYEEEERKRQEQSLSELDKERKRNADLQKQHEDYRASVQERIVSTELRAVATELGFQNPANAIRLVERADLEYDDDGIPTNARKLLEQVAKAEPGMLKAQGTQQRQASTSGGATNPGRSTTAGALTPEQIADVLRGGQAAFNALTTEQQRQVSSSFRAGSHTLRRTV